METIITISKEISIGGAEIIRIIIKSSVSPSLSYTVIKNMLKYPSLVLTLNPAAVEIGFIPVIDLYNIVFGIIKEPS